MNHLEATFKGKNQVWRYIVMFVTVLLVSNTIGAIPLLISLVLKSGTNPALFNQLSENPNDLSILTPDPYSGLVMMLFPFLAGLAAFILLVKPINNRTFNQTINGTRKIRWSHFLISALLWFVISFVYLFFYLKIRPSNFELNNTSISLLYIAFISILLIPFQAGYEEVLFRGYLMQGFSALLNYRWFPLVMTSLLFGLMHAFNPEVKEFGFFTMMPQYIVFGLIFGIITILDDGIEASLGAHAANNIFLVIMVTNRASALQTPALYEQKEIFPWTEFTGLVLSGIAFIIILKFIFGWKNFSLLKSKIEKPADEAVQIL
jgi:membrane protease YdiL (CAAX protease family)